MHHTHEHPTSGPTRADDLPSGPPRANAGPSSNPIRAALRAAALRARLHRRHVERDRRLHAELAVHGLGPAARADLATDEAPYEAAYENVAFTPSRPEPAWAVRKYYDEPGLQHTPSFY